MWPDSADAGIFGMALPLGQASCLGMGWWAAQGKVLTDKTPLSSGIKGSLNPHKSS